MIRKACEAIKSRFVHRQYRKKICTQVCLGNAAIFNVPRFKIWWAQFIQGTIKKLVCFCCCKIMVCPVRASILYVCRYGDYPVRILTSCAFPRKRGKQ